MIRTICFFITLCFSQFSLAKGFLGISGGLISVSSSNDDAMTTLAAPPYEAKLLGNASKVVLYGFRKVNETALWGARFEGVEIPYALSTSNERVIFKFYGFSRRAYFKKSSEGFFWQFGLGYSEREITQAFSDFLNVTKKTAGIGSRIALGYTIQGSGVNLSLETAAQNYYLRSKSTTLANINLSLEFTSPFIMFGK